MATSVSVSELAAGCHPASQDQVNKAAGYLLNHRQSQNDVVGLSTTAGGLYVYGQGDVSSRCCRGRWSNGQISCSGFSASQR